MSNRLAIAAEAKKIVFVPLGKLKKSLKNVRKVPHTKADIKALAASIAALGKLQNPVVEPELGSGANRPAIIWSVPVRAAVSRNYSAPSAL